MILSTETRLALGGSDADCREALAIMDSYHDHHEGDLWDGDYLECVELHAREWGLPDGACRWAIDQIVERYRT